MAVIGLLDERVAPPATAAARALNPNGGTQSQTPFEVDAAVDPGNL